MKKNNIATFITKHYKILIIISFVIASLIIGMKHEPWLDEAQAWLLAKDASISSLFFKYLHAEGHPILWFLVLKAFQFIGLQYKYLFIIPIIFSTIGVAIFVYKSNYPWFIKVLLPFTFFIFYQYTIVARSYCLIFPLLAILATLWDKRYTKIISFTIVMILLINCEIHTYLLAGSLYLYCLIESFKDWKENGYKKENKKRYISFVILFLAFLITLLYIFPTSTTDMPLIFTESYFLSDSFFTAFDNSKIIRLILSFLIMIYFLCYVCNKDKKYIFRLVLFLTPVILFVTLIYTKGWHYGIILLMIIFILWIEHLENKKSVIAFFLLVCLIQIPWSIKSSIDDYKKVYSPAEEIAEFIKEYDYKNLKIISNSFYTGAINPYFKENIFSNWDSSHRFLYLDHSSSFFSERYSKEYVQNNRDSVDIFVEYNFNVDSELNELEDYNKYNFYGNIFFEGKYIEYQNFSVYIRKDINKKQ